MTTGIVTPNLFDTTVIIRHLGLHLRLRRLTRGVVVCIGSAIIGTYTSVGTLDCTPNLLGTIGSLGGGGTARHTTRTSYGFGTTLELGGDVGNTRDGGGVGV